MVRLTKEQKKLLGEQGWIILDNQIILKGYIDNVVNFYTIRPKDKINKLVKLNRQAANPNIKNQDYNNKMTEIAILEKELKLND